MDNTFNTHRNHPLIERQQTYVLEKKNLAIHSEDRDYTQFPNSNKFSIDIGEAMTNVESVRLVSYAFPNNCYNISTSYQNTKLSYSYEREYMFDTSSIPLIAPAISQNNPEAGGTPGGTVAAGVADYRLGMFQCVLEQIFPGIIRPFRSGGAGNPVVAPDDTYFGGQILIDWAAGERGMIYTTQTTNSVPPHPTLTEPQPNFGSLGLPETVDVLYENLANEWISIKPSLPFRNPNNLTTSTVWPTYMDEWNINEPVPENDWTGRFKICFILKNRIITLPEGAYSPDDLANVIQNKLNEQIESYANTLGHQFVATGIDNTVDVNTLARTRRPAFTNPAGVIIIPSAFTVPYNIPGGLSPWNNDNNRQFKPIIVFYNSTTNNLNIGASEGSFSLEADKEIKYNFDKCSPNKFMFSQYTKWGLPYYMGFNKKPYDTFDINIDNDIILNDEGEGVVDFPRDICGNIINNIFLSQLNGLILYTNSSDNWIEPTGKGTFNFYLQGSVTPNPTYNNFNRTISILSSPNNVNLMGEDCIYMEMEKFNNINEIYPFSERTNTMYNCDYGHKSDSAFAIIPLTQTPFGTELGNRRSINTNVFMSEPPIKNVNRLEFKFRYHDGRLVDFKNLPFSFVLEFNMLREEQQRNKIIRIPHLY